MIHSSPPDVSSDYEAPPARQSILPEDPGIRSLVRRFTLAAAIIALLTLAGFASIQYLLNETSCHATLINQAGYQRTLSQRIALYAGQLVDAPDDGRIRQILLLAVETMEDNHRTLQRQASDHNPALWALFQQSPRELEHRVSRFLDDARAILADPGDADAALARVQASAEAPLLEALHAFVQTLAQQSARANRSIRALEGVIVLGILVALALISVFIFRPALHRLTRERRQLQEREIVLREARDTAEQARRLMEAFVANISHEIRTPLNAVVGFTELLGREPLPVTAQHHVETIRHGAHSLLQLINDLLDLSKLQAGRMPVQHRPTDLGQLLDEIRRLFATQAQSRGLYLLVDLDDNDHLALLDEGLLRQILLNLVGNAVKFTDTGGVTLRARLNPTGDGTRGTLELVVADTGPGIETALQETIFEPFRQGDDRATRRHGGTGLGLSISRHLANLLEGNLTVTSEAGMGATFTLRIPDLALSARTNQPPAATATPPSRFAPATVLVVEDDPISRELLVQLLQGAGLRVETAENGQEGLERIQALHPALVLLDMQMPVMDGYTALSRLRATPTLASIPVVACTASSLHQRGKEIRQLCDGVIRKPVDARALLLTLEPLLPRAETAVATTEQPTTETPPARSSLPPEARETLRGWLTEIRRHKSLSNLRGLARALCESGHDHGNAKLIGLGESMETAACRARVREINQLLETLAQRLGD